jgi:choline-sulfatase
MRPNILIVMTDDQGPWAMGCAGTPELKTKALDRLADEGMRFTNFFCASPVCSPARATFLTGRMPSAHGVHDWLKSGNIDVGDGVTWCGKDRSVEYLEGMPGFTERLADAGYVCGLSGKWHLGASGTPQKGHEFWCAHSLGGDKYADYFIFDNTSEMTHETQYVTDLFTDRALDFLDEHGKGEKPFCLSVHYTAPHAPWYREEQPEDIWHMYEDSEFSSIPVLPPHPWGGWDPTPQKRRETLEGYFTAITAMDRNVSRLLDRLDALGIADDTIVFFTSDNGYNMGHHGIHGKGNGTFPVNMFEESVKVPFIARYPGYVPAGTVNHDLVSHYDFMPTLLELLGIENPMADSLPGRSFCGLLRGEEGGHDALVVCDEYGPVRMIRERRWKYVHRYPYGPHELYDLQDDPAESTNLLEDTQHGATLARLRANLEEWFLHYVDPDIDGARLPVTGKGQINYAGRKNHGASAFE